MPICVGTLLCKSTFSMPTSSKRPFILLSLNIGRCKLKSFYLCIPCSLSRCITEIIPGHNVCKHSPESCLQNKCMYSYIYKGQIDEIRVWTKIKTKIDQWSVAGHQTFDTQVVWRNGWHLSCISFNKIWDLPLETKVALVLYRVWQVGEGLCVQLQWPSSMIKVAASQRWIQSRYTVIHSWKP